MIAERKTLKGMAGVVLLMSVILLFGLDSLYSAGGAAPPKKTTPVAAKPTGKELYGMVWTRVRPTRAPSRRISFGTGAVAGVRGAREDKTLQPYWKGEKTKLTPEMEEFSKAAVLLNRAKYEEATAAFNAWLTGYPKSDLAPRVKLSLALSYAYLDKKADAANVLNQFLKDYPGNELEPMAKQLLADLNSGG